MKHQPIKVFQVRRGLASLWRLGYHIEMGLIWARDRRKELLHLQYQISSGLYALESYALNGGLRLRSKTDDCRLSRAAWDLSLALKATEKSKQYDFARAVVGVLRPHHGPRQLHRSALMAIETARNTKRADWGWMGSPGRRYFEEFCFIHGIGSSTYDYEY